MAQGSGLFLVGCLLAGLGLWATPACAQQRVGVLMRNLLEDYSKHDRPLRNYPVVVGHGLNVYKLKDLDVDDQKISLLAYETWNWIDPRLTWDPQDRGDLQQIHIPLEFLWTPDIALFLGYEKPELLEEPLATVSHNGEVTVVFPKILRALCRTRKDACAQSCDLAFGPWVHNSDEIDMKPLLATVELTYYVPDPEWNLLSTAAQRHAARYGDLTGKYLDITYTFNFECRDRHTGRSEF